MAAQTLPNAAQSTRRPLQADGLFCIVCGVLLALDAGAISAFLGMDSSAFILALGLALIPYGAGLFYLASSRPIDTRFLATIILLNIVWILASAILLILDPFHFTTEGKWAVLILADIVAALGIWQFIALRRMR